MGEKRHFQTPLKGERTTIQASGVPITVTGGFTVALDVTATPMDSSSQQGSGEGEGEGSGEGEGGSGGEGGGT